MCKHLYTTAFGFAFAGERLIYSKHNGQVIGLGGWGGATVLYLVGRQELLQLEFWTHTTPHQRPLPADWRASDIGFCRLGISIPDFDATLERLEALNVWTLTAPIKVNGLRRVCYRDPTVGIPVEIMEEGEALPGTRDRYHALKAAIVYVAVSVTDLDQAGLNWTVEEPASFIGGNHVIGAVAHRMKTLSVPHELERKFGYSPATSAWWHPPMRA